MNNMFKPSTVTMLIGFCEQKCKSNNSAMVMRFGEHKFKSSTIAVVMGFGEQKSKSNYCDGNGMWWRKVKI